MIHRWKIYRKKKKIKKFLERPRLFTELAFIQIWKVRRMETVMYFSTVLFKQDILKENHYEIFKFLVWQSYFLCFYIPTSKIFLKEHQHVWLSWTNSTKWENNCFCATTILLMRFCLKDRICSIHFQIAIGKVLWFVETLNLWPQNPYSGM